MRRHTPLLRNCCSCPCSTRHKRRRSTHNRKRAPLQPAATRARGPGRRRPCTASHMLREGACARAAAPAGCHQRHMLHHTVTCMPPATTARCHSNSATHLPQHRHYLRARSLRRVVAAQVVHAQLVTHWHTTSARSAQVTHSILDAMLATLAGGRLRNTCSTEAWEPSSGKRMMGSMDNTSAAVRACALQTCRRAVAALQQRHLRASVRDRRSAR